MTGPLHVVWFKRDLRVTDHKPLTMASEEGLVLPLYIVEPELWAQPDASGRQWNFVAESLLDLQRALTSRGQPLVILVGDAVQMFKRLHESHGMAAIWSHQETGNGWTYARDHAVASWTKSANIPWHEFRQFGVIRRLRSRNGWSKAWDRDMAESQTQAPKYLKPVAGSWPITIPTAADLGLSPDNCPHRQKGGRAQGLANLVSFLGERGIDYRYQMSSPVTAFDASSRLSPHLTWGTISMREVAQATWARLRELKGLDDPKANAWRRSLISFSGRLHWHCHFIQKLEDDPKIEFENLHPAYNGLRPDIVDQRLLSAWSDGATGYPFVDACMRALNQHGWINFRMRAMLMSFASYDLWLPWRDTGLCLARKFTDYEPGIHWSQVQMQSGSTGINTIRIYNPIKQGYDQDPKGLFIRAFVPELEAIPDAFIHEPWLWPGAGNLNYPSPVIDHSKAARAARDAISTIRKSASHRQIVNKIVEKHASRKTNAPTSRRKRKSASKDLKETQLLLDI
jgi:deoxyribodipyrimidine photo-lyase